MEDMASLSYTHSLSHAHTHTHTHTHTYTHHSPADDPLLIASQGARLGAELAKSLNL